MRLEGTLDAFSLPEVFHLLSFSRKTGTLHVQREGAHGTVHLCDGEITGGRADARRQSLARRLADPSLVDDETFARAVERFVDAPGSGLGRTLAEVAGLDPETVRRLAAEQAVDAVFELVRWTEGSFAFLVGEPDPDDVGCRLPVAGVVEECRRRLESWPRLAAAVPAPDLTVTFVPTPGQPPVLTAEEWGLLPHVDGRHTVADLVALSGRGQYAVVEVLAGLVERGLLQVGPASPDRGAGPRRQELLGALEGRRRAEDAPPAVSLVPPPPLADVIPLPASPSIDRTLVLRLIAGVRGLS